MHEPFRQWVIEDRFVGGARPDLGAVGVQLVGDVTPFELMKLRMPERHAFGARLSRLSRRATRRSPTPSPIPPFAALCRRLWAQEIIPTLTPPEGVDLAAYADALLDALRQPGDPAPDLADRDGRQPEAAAAHPRHARRQHRRAGATSPGLILAVAAWMRYVGGVDEAGEPIDVRDPLAARLRALSDGASGAAGKVEALLAVREVFPAALAGQDALREALVAAYRRLERDGARAAVAALAS